MIYTIYQSINKINGKCYIGFDSSWPSRQYMHYYNHRSKSCPNYPFYSALKKYGWENFEWRVLYQSKDLEYCLGVMENYFITENKSHYTQNGYNVTLGGQGTFGKKQSEKNKIEQSNRRTVANKNSRWYNNGLENKFSIEHPGEGWDFGRLYQKPTTKGNKWYNNGIEQKLTKNPPKGWKRGMLTKEQK